MRHPTFLLVSALLLVLFLGVGGLWLWDASREDVIAKGTTVNGVDLGGMKPEEARVKLQRSVLLSMDKPIYIKVRGEKYRLSSKRARVTVNVDAMVAEALDKSRRGNLFSRTWRTLTGDDAHANITPTITYSERVVDSLVARIAKKTNRPVIEAQVVPSPTDLGETNGQTGLKLRRGELKEAIEKELVNPSVDRVIKPDVVKVEPKTSVKDLADKYPYYITVSKDQTKARLWKNLKLIKTYAVAVGMPAWPTSDGLFEIQNKQVDPVWSVPNESWAGGLAGQVIPAGPSNPLKARWLGFNGGQGFHGTSDVNSLGTAASHGCIRMDVPDVIDLYDRVDVGTPVFIG
jgi:lipoprotein-anchoring transpeptidase ErfK/SrfK